MSKRESVSGKKNTKKVQYTTFFKKNKIYSKKSLTHIYCCDIMISVAHEKLIFLRKMKRILKES